MLISSMSSLLFFCIVLLQCIFIFYLLVMVLSRSAFTLLLIVFVLCNLKKKRRKIHTKLKTEQLEPYWLPWPKFKKFYFILGKRNSCPKHKINHFDWLHSESDYNYRTINSRPSVQMWIRWLEVSANPTPYVASVLFCCLFFGMYYFKPIVNQSWFENVILLWVILKRLNN